MPTASPSMTISLEEKKNRRQYFLHHKMMKYSGALLKDFELSTIQKSTGPVRIKDLSFIASYNWSNSDEPVIFIPGISISLYGKFGKGPNTQLEDVHQDGTLLVFHIKFHVITDRTSSIKTATAPLQHPSILSSKPFSQWNQILT